MRTKLEYGTRRLEIEVEYSERKRLSITVSPEKNVTVKAPVGYEEEKIQACIRKRAPWIVRQLDYFEQFHPLQPERRYVSGETHYYLGRQYRLRILPADQGMERVRLKGRFFVMELVAPADANKAKNLLLPVLIT